MAQVVAPHRRAPRPSNFWPRLLYLALIVSGAAAGNFLGAFATPQPVVGLSGSSMDQAQVSSFIAKLIAPIQASACDGETVYIKCNEDYIIDIITVEQTILGEQVNSVRDTTVTSAELTTTITTTTAQPPQTTTTTPTTTTTASILNSTNGTQTRPLVATHDDGNKQRQRRQEQICKPFAGPEMARQSLADGNSGACDQEQANARAQALAQVLGQLVKNECRSRNSCLLDLRWPRSLGATSTTNGSEQLPPAHGTGNYSSEQQQRTAQQTTPLSQAASSKANAVHLSRLFNEPCPANRKLLEIVYKCRPLKMTRRIVCRGAQLELECPPEKRLAIGTAEFGAIANDTKSHDRCQVDGTQQRQQQQQVASPEVSLSQTCLANISETRQVLAENCQFRPSCRLQVHPSVLGEANCAPGRAEYLKLVYTCANETLLVNNGSYLVGPKGAKGSRQAAHAHMADQVPPFTSSTNIASSALLSSTTSLAAPPAHSPGQVSTSTPTTPVNHLSPGQSQPQHDQQEEEFQSQIRFQVSPRRAGVSEAPRPPGQQEDVHSLYTIVASDPQLVINTSQWSNVQKVRWLLARYQPQVVLLVLGVFSILAFAVVMRACQRPRRAGGHSRNSSASSKDSKDSANSSSCSSGAGFKSLPLSSTGSTSSTGLGAPGAPAGGATAAVPAHLKHNSCSESCFSLDDYHLQTPGTPGCATGDGQSPDEAFAHLRNQPQQQQARPKLWTIYSHEPASNGHLRLGSQTHHHHHHHQTMRPTRTFVGQPMRNLPYQCLAPGAGSGPGEAQVHDTLPARSSVSNAADLLLAMAANHQHQQHQQQQPANWLANNTNNQQQPSPIERLTMLMNADLQQQQQFSSSNSHCAYHQTQQQQQQQYHQPQQQPLLFPPVHLELPQQSQLAGQQQQQQMQPALIDQQQQADARQIQPPPAQYAMPPPPST